MIFQKKTEREKMKKELVSIIDSIKKGKELKQKNKEKVLEMSYAWNKERLFENFVKKVEIFYTYDDAESFPLEPWLDRFFEK